MATHILLQLLNSQLCFRQFVNSWMECLRWPRWGETGVSNVRGGWRIRSRPRKQKYHEIWIWELSMCNQTSPCLTGNKYFDTQLKEEQTNINTLYDKSGLEDTFHLCSISFIENVFEIFPRGNEDLNNRLTKACDVIVQRYRNSNTQDNKMHILWCMELKSVKFQRRPLKFHTKVWTHTAQNMHLTRLAGFTRANSYISVTAWWLEIYGMSISDPSWWMLESYMLVQKDRVPIIAGWINIYVSARKAHDWCPRESAVNI